MRGQRMVRGGVVVAVAGLVGVAGAREWVGTAAASPSAARSTTAIAAVLEVDTVMWEWRYQYTAEGLLRKATPPGFDTTDAERVLYDAKGNVDTVITSLGHVTAVERDAVGRVVVVRSPVDVTDSTYYDSRDRVTRKARSAPFGHTTMLMDSLDWYGMNDAADVQTMASTYEYDEEGNVVEVATDEETHEWVYDAVGRVTSTTSQAGGTTATVYGTEGDTVRVVTARSDTITTIHDVLGRLRKRTVSAVTYSQWEYCDPLTDEWTPTCPSGWKMIFPVYPNSGYSLAIAAEVDTFTYDMMGNLKAAHRVGGAFVDRTYYPNGALKTDTIAWGGTKYGIVSHYDLNGRRDRLVVPPLLGGTIPRDTMEYTYDEHTGLLTEVRDVMDSAYTYQYSVRGEVDTIWYPDGLIEARAYDLDGRIVSPHTIAYDDAGRIESTYSGEYDYRYSGLGGLLTAEWSYSGTVEHYLPNYQNVPLVSMTTSGTNWPPITMEFNALLYGGVTLTSEGGSACNFLGPSCTYGNGFYQEGTGHDFDESGNNVFTTYVRTEHLFMEGEGNVDQVMERMFSARFYAGDQTLRYEQRHKRSAYFPHEEEVADAYRDGEWVTHQYDALGRRVVTSTTRSHASLCSATGKPTGFCNSSVDTILWDGDQILAEVHNGSAAVRYTHGIELDRPLSIVYGNADQLIIPWKDARGAYYAASTVVGSSCCSLVDWPGLTTAWYKKSGFEREVAYDWRGSLIVGQATSSGLLYMRNRFYDPMSGAFTQPDPIGIAGGLNIYGYAGGDPINFWDPFGLCPKAWRDADGRCPGGLEVWEWEKVEDAAACMSADYGSLTTQLLKGGNVRGYSGEIFGDPRTPTAWGANDPAAPNTIWINRTMQGAPLYGGSVFNDQENLFKTVVHEGTHVLQNSRERGQSRSAADQNLFEIEAEFQARIEWGRGEGCMGM